MTWKKSTLALSILVVVASGALFQNCGSGFKAGETDSSSEITVGGLGGPADFIGAWHGQCRSDDGLSKSQTIHLSAGASTSQLNYSIEEVWSLGSGCSNPMVMFTYTGVYTAGPASTVVSGASTFTFATQAVTLKALNQTGVTTLNQSSACGFTNWAVQVNRSIWPSCDIVSGVPSSGGGIWSVSGNTLTFGNEAGTALDPNSSFTR